MLNSDFLKKMLDPSRAEKATPVVVNQYSQPHVLEHYMRCENITHDQTVVANVSPVRLESNFGKMDMYFCPVHTVDVLKTISAGDGGRLPESVVLEGFSVPRNLKPGLYALKNVKLHSNGNIQVIATEDTYFEQV